MSKEKFFPIADSKYGDGLFLEEYNGAFSIVAGKESDAGRFKRWCRPQVGKDKFADKSVPMKVTLGDREAAIEMLQNLLKCFTGADVPQVPEYQDGDIPF